MKAKPNKPKGGMVLKLSGRDDALLAAAGRSGPSSRFHLKRILVPIDFSDCSKKALLYALALAAEHEAALTLAYVVPTSSYAVGEYGGVDYAAIEADMREGAEKQLAALVAAEVRPGIVADTAVSAGSPALELIQLARSLPADLVVMSTHGRTGLKHVLLGSVVEHVVRSAPCPVLVVRETEREFVAL